METIKKAVFPFWYGIKPIQFIYHGDWADPEIRYNRMTVNSTIVEDSMWERYCDVCKEYGIIADENEGFADYMRAHKEDIIELIYLAYKSK